jgi:hypothetical protein
MLSESIYRPSPRVFSEVVVGELPGLAEEGSKLETDEDNELAY